MATEAELTVGVTAPSLVLTSATPTVVPAVLEVQMAAAATPVQLDVRAEEGV